MLQQRVQTDFPVKASDSLAFYDVGTYASAIEDEFVEEFCETVGIAAPSPEEIRQLQTQSAAILTVNDLIRALGNLLKLRSEDRR
jgi:hypothetical protein